MSASDDHIKEWIDKTDHDLGSAKLIFLSNEELETAIEIAQEFRNFAVSSIGITNL